MSISGSISHAIKEVSSQLFTFRIPRSSTANCQCDKIESRPPQSSLTPPPEPHSLPRKRATAKSSKGQPKSKKAKVQHAVVDDAVSDDDDESESQDFVSPGVQQSIKQRENLTADKPEPFGQPPMFARTRGGLCETIHQFKSNQGSGYRNKSRGGLSMYYGFLCDGGVYERDFFGDQVIICTMYVLLEHCLALLTSNQWRWKREGCKWKDGSCQRSEGRSSICCGSYQRHE